MLPLSTYTPEKYRSSFASAYPSRGSSSTPRCQSAPLLLVLALTGATSCVRLSPPVECQKPTVLALKSISCYVCFTAVSSNSVSVRVSKY